MNRHTYLTEMIRIAAVSFVAGLILLAAYLAGPTIAGAHATTIPAGCWNPVVVLDQGTKPAVQRLVNADQSGRFAGMVDPWLGTYAKTYSHGLTVVYRGVAERPDPVVHVDSCGYTAARRGK